MFSFFFGLFSHYIRTQNDARHTHTRDVDAILEGVSWVILRILHVHKHRTFSGTSYSTDVLIDCIDGDNDTAVYCGVWYNGTCDVSHAYALVHPRTDT